MSGMQYERRQLDGIDFNNSRNMHNEAYVSELMNEWSDYVDLVPKSRNDPSDLKRKSMAMVLENTNLAIPDAVRKERAIMEASATTTGAIDDYAQTIFPVLMRVFPNLIAHDLVSIQPMSGPIGAVFYFEYKHATTKGSTTRGDNLVEEFNPYYSSEYVDGEILQTGDGTNFGGAGSALNVTLQFTPVFAFRTGSIDPNHQVIIRELDPATGDVVQEARDDGQGGLTFTPSGGNTAGAIEYETGSIAGLKFQNAVAQNNVVKAFYYYNMEGNTQVPRVTLNIERSTLDARTRRLNATWSAEAADDLRALHGVEGEAQLLIGLSNQIGLEIDREILNDLIAGAQSSVSWDRQNIPSGTTELDHIRTLLTVLTSEANAIHQRSKRAPGNWIVTSPGVAALMAQFQRNGDFLPAAPVEDRPHSYGNVTSDFGVFRFGTLSNRFQVYQDPFIQQDLILLGYKGQSYLDAGYVYAPYVPLQMTPTFLDPDDGQYKKGLRTRYAKKMLRGSFYSTIRVSNLY
jgi:hypothetical protein